MAEIAQYIDRAKIECQDIGTWEFNVNTNEILFDDQWLELIGYKRDEAVFGRNFWEERIHPEDKAIVLEWFDNFIKGITDKYKLEYRLKTKEGFYVHVLDIGSIIKQEAYTHFKKIKILTVEVSGKITIQSEIEEEKYKSIFEHLNDAFCQFDFSGQITEANINFCKLFDILEHEIKESNVQSFCNVNLLNYFFRDLTNNTDKHNPFFETMVAIARAEGIAVVLDEPEVVLFHQPHDRVQSYGTPSVCASMIARVRPNGGNAAGPDRRCSRPRRRRTRTSRSGRWARRCWESRRQRSAPRRPA